MACQVIGRVTSVGIVCNVIRGGSDPPSLPPCGPNQRAIWSRTRAKSEANGSAKRVLATRRPPKERRSGEWSRLRHRHVDGTSSQLRTRGRTQRAGDGKKGDAVGDAAGSRATYPSKSRAMASGTDTGWSFTWHQNARLSQ